MEKWSGKSLVIGDLIATTPIIQGGMGVGISLSGLASAVANEGGIGVISAAFIGMNELDYKTNFPEANIRALRKEIRKARELTDGIIGVNIMYALSNYEDMVKVSIEEGIDIIFVGAGLPLNLPAFINEKSHTKLVPIVSSGRAAQLIANRWFTKYNYIPDAIVVEGPKAGGHLGFSVEQIADENYALEKLVMDTVEVTNIIEQKTGKKVPVIAGGGVYSGSDIELFQSLGASGVQMGTRFVTTLECEAPYFFKKAYMEAEEKDIIIINSPVGMPGRAIKNNFLDNINKEGSKEKSLDCVYACIKTCKPDKSPYCIAKALFNAKRGNLKGGFAFAGANAYLVKDIVSVHDLLNELSMEYENAVSGTIKNYQTEKSLVKQKRNI